MYSENPKLSKQKYLLIHLFLCSFLLSGCVTTKKTTYLQEIRGSDYSDTYSPPEEYLIQPNDNLYVRVSTPDPRWSEIFNPMPGGAGMTLGGDDATQLLSYPVQLDGTVALPYIGFIVVGGRTLAEAKMAIEAVLVDYVTDGSVSVRLVNNYITILGEVRAPGMYPIMKDRLNIFQAIALAGDLSDFAERQELSIIRNTSEGSVVKEFNINDRRIVDSEFYFVLPNDVIYIKPMKGKFFGLTNYPFGFILSSITAAITLFLLVQNQLLLQQQ